MGNILNKSFRENQNTHFIVTISGSVILTAYLLQQYLHEHALMLCCMYITYFVFILWETRLHMGKV